MSDYATTTAEAKNRYTTGCPGSALDTSQSSRDEAAARFDRWLTGVKAVAWLEGAVAALITDGYNPDHIADSQLVGNPYLGEER